MKTNELQKDVTDNKSGEKTLGEGGFMKEFLLKKELPLIGPYVVKGSEISENLREIAAKQCQNRFRKEDIAVLVVLDEEKKGTAGIAFTERAICHWTESDGFIAEIGYGEVEAVGPVDSWLIFTLSEETHFPVFCGEDAQKQSYAYEMFLYMIDVLEFYDHQQP